MSETIHLGGSGILEIDGKILLGRRVKDDTSFPGMWCTPGGGVNFGETIDEAIKREFFEEVNLQIGFSLPPWTSIQERIALPGNNRKHTVLIFRKVILPYGGLSNLAAKDGFDEVRWFTQEEIYHPSFTAVTPLTQAALLSYWKIP